MKIISILLTAFVAITAATYFSSFQMWHSLIEHNERKAYMFQGLESTTLTAAVCFSLAFIVSLILTVKKKYKANGFLFGACILATIIISMITHA